MDGSDTEPEDAGNEDDEDSMAVDAGPNGTPRKPKNKLKKRKSDVLDVSGIQHEQMTADLLNGQQLMHHKLRLKYYADGLEFIRQMEAAIEPVGELLGSKAKAEVLEAMDFFRTAHEYQMEGAEVRRRARHSSVT
jgi:condensin complex subunit 1